jgi:hypothetical protein
MQNKIEQAAVPSEFRLFRRREKPQSVLNHFSAEKKPLEIRSKPFLRRETSEFCSETFLGRENPSEFHSVPFLGREKPLEFRSEPFFDEKNLGIPFRTIFGREKTSELRSESFSEEKKTSEKDHLF